MDTPVEGFVEWNNYYYFTTISYPVWQIIYGVSDQITGTIIVLFILKSCLYQVENLSTLVYIMLKDYKFLIIFTISIF